MPSKSPRQARTMRAAAHDPKFAKRMGIPQSVAEDYVDADRGSFQDRRARGAAKGGRKR
jgi:hypothetical protein